MNASPRSFVRLLAVAGSLILLHQVLDLVTATAGIDVSTPTGRVRLITMLWSRAPALITADVIVVAATTRLGSGALLRALGLLHLALAVVALVGLPVFLTAAGRVASEVGGAQVTAFRITVVRILAALLAVASGALVAGRALRGQAAAPAVP